MVTRADVPAYAGKFLKACDLGGPTAATIKLAVLEEMKGFDGKLEKKVIVYFSRQFKPLPLNLTNFISCCDILGEETDDWTGGKIELVPSTVSMNGKIHDCIRIKKPGAVVKAKPKLVEAEKPPYDDEIPL